MWLCAASSLEKKHTFLHPQRFHLHKPFGSLRHCEAMDFTPLYNKHHNLKRLISTFSWKLRVQHILYNIQSHPGVSSEQINKCSVILPHPKSTTIVCVITFQNRPFQIERTKSNSPLNLFRHGYVCTKCDCGLNRQQPLKFSAADAATLNSFKCH